MTSDYQLRAATDADTPAILALVKSSLGEGTIPRHDRYWSWKHERGPFGRSAVLVADAGGELVGLRVFMRWEWRAGGAVARSVRAVDTATHPAWRGKGIFSRLTRALAEELADEGVHFVFNTPNGQSRPGYLKMGWSSLGRTSLLIRPSRPLRLAAALASRPRPRDDPGAAGLPAGAGRVAALLDRPELPDFLRRVAADPDGRLWTPRSPEYLRWRYADVPGFEYGATWEFDGGHGAAIIWRLTNRWGLRELRLCEVLAPPGPRSRALARAAINRVTRLTEVDYLSAMAAPATPEVHALLRAGFLPAPRIGPILTVRPLAPDFAGPDPLRRRSWRHSIGDLELF